jgi:hypothetical protein
MTAMELDQGAFTALKVEVGSLDHLRLTDPEYIEAIYALAWFVGRSLTEIKETVFLTDVPDPDAVEHRVYWLRGKTIGCLVIGRHQGPEGDENAKLVVSGYVRPLSDIVRLELKDLEVHWHWGGRRVADLKPTMVVHLRGEEIVVDVASREDDFTSGRALEFVDRLKATVG